MSTHNLKTWPEFFQSVLDGTKTFEVRKDDRGYQVGDTLVLQEWMPEVKEIGVEWYAPAYTGRECQRTVTYILPGGQFGLAEGYVVMGLGNPEVEHLRGVLRTALEEAVSALYFRDGSDYETHLWRVVDAIRRVPEDNEQEFIRELYAELNGGDDQC